jgi:hypothetical protein
MAQYLQRSLFILENLTFFEYASVDELDATTMAMEKVFATGSNALYGNKSQGTGKGKNPSKDKKNEDRPSCPHCTMLKPRHSPQDCLENNKEKRDEWERKNGKKWTPYRKHIEKKKNGAKDEGNDSKS